ncbi:MAG: CotH kinase family protein [Bryobacteraceae bacterium]|nr:CotH kinase family protein [Bryobacteraceae bacterium]
MLKLSWVLLAGWILSAAAKAPVKSGELFAPTEVWTVHLKFTAAQWEAMEPKGGGPGPGPGLGRGGPGMFSPAMFIAPAFLKGDRNGDGKLSRAEFAALGGDWFAQWDAAKSGKVTQAQFGEGLGSIFEMPGPGGPGGPGERMLQAPKGKKNGLSGAMGIEFEYVHASLDFAGQPLADVAVRYKGNGTFMMSRGQLKKSMKIDVNRYTKDAEFAGVTTLNLHSNVTDTSWMNEVLSHRLYRDAKVPAPRTSYAKVYVTVDGKYDRKYLGLYSLVEDIDNHFIAHHYATKAGALFKPVTQKLFQDLGNDWEAYEQPYDAKNKLTAAQKNRVMEFGRLVSHASDAEFTARVGEFLNLDNFSRYMATTVWLSTLDSLLGMGQNFYVYLNAKNQFEFLPWDLDHSFGQFNMAGTQEQREQLSIRHPWQGDNKFLERVYAQEAFQKLYRARLNEFSQTIFQPARLAKQVDELAAAIRPAVAEESAEKLARFDKVVAGQSVPAMMPGGFGPPPGMGPMPMMGGPGGPGGPGGGFGGDIKPIKAFVTPRADSVRQQLAGKSEGMQVNRQGPGGQGNRGGEPRGGPGQMLGMMLFPKFDTGKDGTLTRDELQQTLGRWFASWNSDHSGQLTAEQLTKGINQDLMPPMPPMFGAPMPGRPQ